MTSPDTEVKELKTSEGEGDAPVNRSPTDQEMSGVKEKQLPETHSPGNCEGHPLLSLGKSCSLTDITPPKQKVRTCTCTEITNIVRVTVLDRVLSQGGVFETCMYMYIVDAEF